MLVLTAFNGKKASWIIKWKYVEISFAGYYHFLPVNGKESKLTQLWRENQLRRK